MVNHLFVPYIHYSVLIIIYNIVIMKVLKISWFVIIVNNRIILILHSEADKSKGNGDEKNYHPHIHIHIHMNQFSQKH